MNAAAAILPVVFMLGLGYFTRVKSIISPEQNEGIKKLIFSILLPILVFNASFTMSIDGKYAGIMGFMFLLQCLTLGAGFLIFRIFKTPCSHISPYLMTTIEGGNAFYPLYISLVGTGYTSYFVLLDIPGIFMIFLVIPLVLARITSGRTSAAEMLRSIYTNPIICSLLAGILLNLTGAADAFMATPFSAIYQGLVSTATAPIAPLILFTLGHSFSMGKSSLLPMAKTLAARMLLMACGAAAIFMIFPWVLDDLQLKIAVVLFLSAPPAFAMPIILKKLCRSREDNAFCSTYISMHMLVTVLVFTLIALIMV